MNKPKKRKDLGPSCRGRGPSPIVNLELAETLFSVTPPSLLFSIPQAEKGETLDTPTFYF